MQQHTLQHEINWIVLAEALGPRSPWLKPLLERFETPERIFEAGETVLREIWPDIPAGTLSLLLGKRKRTEAERIALWCHRNGVRILTPDDPLYPARLREIDEPPAVLYCKGTLPALDKHPTVGVVGTRHADAYGEQVTYKLSFELAAAGAVIVSGMAAGLDAIAAAAALNAGGVTIAVLGCGIDLVYPKQHGKLAAEIAEHGAILTEYAPGTKPNGWNFPMRNRIISALSNAVLVVEAGEGSGALITARYAVVQGKTLFAVPGDITSARSVGTNRLLADGAYPALCAQEMLEQLQFLYREGLRLSALPEAMQYSAITPEALRRFGLHTVCGDAAEKPLAGRERMRRSTARPQAPSAGGSSPASKPPALTSLAPEQRRFYDMLPDAPFSVDCLTEQGVPVAQAMSTLTVFEIYGLITSRPGGMFEKK